MRTCRNKKCGKKFMPTFNNLQKVCSPLCAVALVCQLAEKKDKIRMREMKVKTRTHSYYEEKLQVIVNAIARKIDEKEPCISSGRKTGKMNGGHYASVGSNNSIRFNLHNVHKQSFADNHFLSSNREGYDKGLIARYGQEYFDYVKYGLTKDFPEVKLSKDQLRACIASARAFLKELNEGKWSEATGIEKRNVGNMKIGIYI